MAYTTKLMTSSVGIAIRSRRMMYRPTLPAPHPIEAGVGSAVEVVHRTTVHRRCSSLRRLVPLRDVPHLGVPWVQVRSLKGLALSGCDLEAVHQRDDHDVLDQDVIGLDPELSQL